MGWRLGEKEMDVFGHYDVAEDQEAIFQTQEFEGVFEDRGSAWGGEVRVAAVATEGDEVVIAGLLSSFEAWGHGCPPGMGWEG